MVITEKSIEQKQTELIKSIATLLEGAGVHPLTAKKLAAEIVQEVQESALPPVPSTDSYPLDDYEIGTYVRVGRQITLS